MGKEIDHKEFGNKVVLVTGAASGIGRASGTGICKEGREGGGM